MVDGSSSSSREKGKRKRETFLFLFKNLILILKNDHFHDIKANSLIKKSSKQRDKIQKSFDFLSHCYREADRSVQQGGHSNAMKALQKINTKSSLGSVVRDVHDSLPTRNMSTLTMEDRASLFSKTTLLKQLLWLLRSLLSTN